MALITAANWIGANLAAGRYEVVAKLGEGGMGHVYRARDNNLGVDVVIKAPRPELLVNEGVVERFQAETRSLVRLAHPHVVRVIDVGSHQGVPFTVMQYLSGGSLEDRARVTPEGRETIEPESLADWLPQLADALDFVHRMNHIHRDVKPANILFDAHNNVYLGDFGVIKAMAAITEEADAGAGRRGQTRPGVALGTPEYMAPEIIKGDPYDGSADQYSLAVTLYDLLTGRLPHEGPTPAAILIKLMTEPTISPSDLRPSLPRGVSRAILKGMAINAEERFPDCGSFARAVLEQIQLGQARAGSGAFATVSTALMNSRLTTRVLSVRLNSPEPTSTVEAEVARLANQWSAKILDATPAGIRLRFDVRSGWFKRLLNKEEFFVAELTLAERGRGSRVTVNISYSGVRQSQIDLVEQGRHILRMLKESLRLSNDESTRVFPVGAGLGSETGISAADGEGGAGSETPTTPIEGFASKLDLELDAIRPPADTAYPREAAVAASAAVAATTTATGPPPGETNGRKREAREPEAGPEPKPGPALEPAPAAAAEAPRRGRPPTAIPDGGARIVRLSIQPVHAGAGSEETRVIACEVARVSQRALSLISPTRLANADVTVHLDENMAGLRARLIHCLPRDDHRYQLGVVFREPLPDLAKLFESGSKAG